MTEAVAERMAALNAHETRFMFESFDHAAAWQWVRRWWSVHSPKPCR